MIRYVAFLRGINVGGHAIIKMEALREIFEMPGLKNISTYIQSGNVIFDSKETDEASLVKKIEKKLLKDTGKEIKVLLRTMYELAAMVKLNPFGKMKEDKDTKLYVSFLNEVPGKFPALPYTSPKKDFEVLPIKGREVYYITYRMANGSYGNPLIFIEKEYGKGSTSRNWNTIVKILAAFSQ